MATELAHDQWSIVATICVAAITAAFAATQWIYDLRPARLRVLGVDGGNTFLIQMVVLGFTALCLYLSVKDILGAPSASWVYLLAVPFAAGFMITTLIGRLAEREKMWRKDSDGRRISLKWDRIRKIVVVPFVSTLAPLSTGALKHAPALLPFLRV